uniref:DUF4585 domain-containing protein n=1 Tax=Leptobrachium leishanense TaxID=445787 RepID=A0A8C5QJN1_9ANUR
MLRHKKHKKLTDGQGSGVGVMDDTDREVSSFTDRAFRSLCVAEEEPFNEVPHLPSPIRGMPLSTKYHLGIFNLSVRKTQPLPQLPILPGHRGKWAPTFQPLLNRRGVTEGKTNMRKICAPEPRGFRHHSKVSSLVKTFDDIENEVPEGPPSRLILPVISQKGNLPEEGHHVDPQTNPEIDAREVSNLENLAIHESHNLQRRTARDVFLESQAEKSTKLSRSPHLLGSSLGDPAKKITQQKESLKTSFLHSENSAFKSWSDISKRMNGGDERENSIPGTPPMMRCATPCSPLLSRTKCGVWTRESGLELGWASPASSVSSSYDPVQMLRSVPPLPTKRHGKQPKDTRPKPVAPKIPQIIRNQEDDMQVDTTSPSFKDQLHSTRLPNGLEMSKSPRVIQEKTPCEETEMLPIASRSQTEDKEKIQEKTISPQLESPPLTRKYEVEDKHIEEKLVKEHLPPQGRIKTLIQQMEKETNKDLVLPRLLDSENKLEHKELPREEAAAPPLAVTPTESLTSKSVPHSGVLIPPWRRLKASQKMEVEEKIFPGHSAKRESASNPIHVNLPTNEDISIAKPTSSSFNITSLLTPVIRRKNIKDAMEEHPMVITPPPVETVITKEQESKDGNLHSNRNDYKSRATSLMFNLKDMRKRVKSTYSPAASGKNGNDNHTGESKVQEQSNHRIALMDISKWVMDRENNTHAPVIHSPRVVGGNENKTNSQANVSDNYLSLSSPPQAMECTVTGNGEAEAEPEDVQIQTRLADENMISDRLHPIEHNIRKGEDYPSLNLYPKEQTSPEVNAEILTDQTPVSVNVTDEQHLPDKITEEPVSNTILGNVVDVSPTHRAINSDNDIGENIQPDQLESHPCQDMDIQKISKSEEDSIQEERDTAKDDLQYYAVSSCALEEGAERGGVEPEKEKMTEVVKESETQIEETAHEEIGRPASTTMFRPNLFRIKDNTIKSCPVTKSVRRPLMRSMSEDSLVYRKESVSHFEDNKHKLLEDKVINSIAANNDTEETEIVRKENIRELLNMRPVSEISKPISPSQIKKQKEESDSLELLNKLSSLNEQWRKIEEHKPEVMNIKENPHEGPFFHQVETCISEVTGPSPEYNTLIIHNADESLHDLVNGDLASPPFHDADNTNYSALDSSLMHLEDAITLSEDIVCSSITSPMSESVTCSMVASPMSINSSGFTTALSCFEDFPSPTSSSIISRNAKFIFPPPERSTSALPGIIEHENTECFNNSKEQVQDMEHLKMQSAKPPAVPPKTEKALRRAKRLTKKRRKTDLPLKLQDGELCEADLILDVPSPRITTPNSLIQSYHKPTSYLPKVLQPEGSITSSSTPSFQATQRKLLQDPDSGQYFVVDIPVHFRVKTFYDPETGKYLQVSLPPSERESPTLDTLNNQFILYPGLSPMPISSISSLKDLTQHLENSGSEKSERIKSWDANHEEDEYPKEQRYIESMCDSCDQSMSGTPHSMDRFLSRSRSLDIISIKDLDDFAMEAIS